MLPNFFLQAQEPINPYQQRYNQLAAAMDVNSEEFKSFQMVPHMLYFSSIQQLKSFVDRHLIVGRELKAQIEEVKNEERQRGGGEIVEYVPLIEPQDAKGTFNATEVDQENLYRVGLAWRNLPKEAENSLMTNLQLPMEVKEGFFLSSELTEANRLPIYHIFSEQEMNSYMGKNKPANPYTNTLFSEKQKQQYRNKCTIKPIRSKGDHELFLSKTEQTQRRIQLEQKRKEEEEQKFLQEQRHQILLGEQKNIAQIVQENLETEQDSKELFGERLQEERVAKIGDFITFGIHEFRVETNSYGFLQLRLYGAQEELKNKLGPEGEGVIPLPFNKEPRQPKRTIGRDLIAQWSPLTTPSFLADRGFSILASEMAINEKGELVVGNPSNKETYLKTFECVLERNGEHAILQSGDIISIQNGIEFEVIENALNFELKALTPGKGYQEGEIIPLGAKGPDWWQIDASRQTQQNPTALFKPNCTDISRTQADLIWDGTNLCWLQKNEGSIWTGFRKPKILAQEKTPPRPLQFLAAQENTRMQGSPQALIAHPIAPQRYHPIQPPQINTAMGIVHSQDPMNQMNIIDIFKLEDLIEDLTFEQIVEAFFASDLESAHQREDHSDIQNIQKRKNDLKENNGALPQQIKWLNRNIPLLARLRFEKQGIEDPYLEKTREMLDNIMKMLNIE